MNDYADIALLHAPAPTFAIDTRSEPAGIPLTAARAALELGFLISVLIVLMWVMPILRTPYWIRYVTGSSILILVIVSQLRERADWRDLGLRFDNVRTASRQLAVPSAIVVVSLLTAGWALDSLREPQRFLLGFVSVPIWGFVQQLMVLAFCNRRLRVLCGRKSAIATGLMFGLVHAPNPPLMLACTIGGYIWAAQFEREPNLFATALSHGVVSTCLSSSLPRWILASMKVGYPYLIS